MVQNVTSDGSVRVSFVDYGNTEDVPRDNLRQISPSFLKLPFQAIKCWLSGESYFLLKELLHLLLWGKVVMTRSTLQNSVLLGLFVCFLFSALWPVLWSDIHGFCLLLYWSKGSLFSSASLVMLTGF